MAVIKKRFQKKKVCRFCVDKIDIDYKDVLEFFLATSGFLLLFISVFSCFTAYNANKWIAENYRYAGYKVAAPNTLVRSLLKKDWGLTDDDFIEESK